MTKFEELTQAFASSVKKQRDFETECQNFGSRLHGELIRFLGCTEKEVAVFPPEANHHDKSTRYTAVGAMQWDEKISSWRMLFKVRFPHGWVAWPVEISRVPNAFVVRVIGFEDRIDSHSSAGFDAMFQRWIGVLIDDFENDLQRMIDGKPPEPSRRSIGFKTGGGTKAGSA
jgi:hypothetical protein